MLGILGSSIILIAGLSWVGALFTRHLLVVIFSRHLAMFADELRRVGFCNCPDDKPKADCEVRYYKSKRYSSFATKLDQLLHEQVWKQIFTFSWVLGSIRLLRWKHPTTEEAVMNIMYAKLRRWELINPSSKMGH